MAERLLDYHVAITDEMIDEARAYTGMPVRVEPWNHEATLDTIRHYAWGIGDANPLWCDEEYAASGPYGTVVAPPAFLYSSYDGAIGLGFPGVQPFYSGTEWRFHDVVRRGDRIRPEATMGDLEVREGANAGRFVIQRVHTRYVREADDVVVAEATAGTFRVARSQASGGLRYEARGAHRFTDEQLDDIARQALSEPLQGDKPLYVDDVRAGESIPQVVKGPLKQITMTAYYAGCIGSPGYKADEVAWRYRDWALHDPGKLPNNYDPTYFSERVLPSLGHQNADVARELGMPGAYGNGPQKCGWMSHPITNWMGDHGRLERLEVRLRRPDVFGDVTWCGGTVTAVDEGEGPTGTVTLALRATNQRGEVTAEGTAEVALPRRRPADPA
ncbi:MaoC family dehydratase N-terminal domain-containing protein [Sphaerisporangium rubeum]|uniref:Acyl dehydratase n=1 Tax=Sphaerisporangium rubeum TaxID=321317 RepID=A0A7X0IDK3_9ACTN|nr:MaoC family dehydratase N-terminal domain-containing protein [Sphaerisporangium rubeum]MBB6473287.1 acyl dehydratase [Sphaerisporangium rubeum]